MIINDLLTKFFGTSHEREVKRLLPRVHAINALEAGLLSLSDDELAARGAELRDRVRGGAALESVLEPAFALGREAADRRLGMLNILKERFAFDLSRLEGGVREEAERARARIAEGEALAGLRFGPEFYAEVRRIFPESRWPFRMRCFDMQLVGGMVLHQGMIAEMKTGEGKTLVATLTVYLNALEGKGVHVVTTNDYLAKVGAEENRPLYEFLGLSVGKILVGMREKERREGYHADVTYGTNNEFGFDYLRDNMARELADCVQRELHYAIVDEVDSILIDEARTPLIISGPAEESTGKYMKCDNVVRTLEKETHYVMDEKTRFVGLTEEGVNECEKQLGLDNLYGDVNTEWVHHVTQALTAQVFYKRDVDYVVRDREVVIVDEFTGRMMEGRRYSEGLHQAIEAKERVPIARENQTLATITFQNYFRMYKKLAGMTGTADTEATEFGEIYKLRVVAVPTNRPMVRLDRQDLIYRSHREKLDAIVADIKERHEQGQPVLVGTVSIEKSEEVARRLQRDGIPHEVLNAKQHEREAGIIEGAGEAGRVTIATNMAGRGVDIRLGPGVVEAGGLYVLGTERHEARRIDNQLRGRSGRQGDPGESQFYLSLEDELLRIFGSDRISRIMDRLGAVEGEVITHPLVTRAIANAQKRVEGRNFEIRKHLLDYDDVMNRQRTVIYRVRQRVLRGEEVQDEILSRIDEACDMVLSPFTEAGRYPESWDLDSFYAALRKSFAVDYTITEEKRASANAGTVLEEVIALVKERYRRIEEAAGAGQLREFERHILLLVMDHFWKEHLLSMDHLRDAIRYRGYAQRDPKNEYKREGLEMFEALLDRIALATAERLLHIDVEAIERQREALIQARAQAQPVGVAVHPSAQDAGPAATRPAPASAPGVARPQGAPGMAPAARPVPHQPPAAALPKVGRNDPCPCGSGKKFKKCHGAAG